MSDLREVSSARCFGGWQRVVEHDSSVLGVPMRVGIYEPPDATGGTLLYLSGLTCTEQNVITKAGAQRWCAQHGLAMVCPDTSPRGDGVADDQGWDLGQGAGFYVDATQAPWAKHFQMETYVTNEVMNLAAEAVGAERVGITGHSMGGHGALVLALRHPGLFASVSALAPILEPCDVPWGRKAFGAYFGDDIERWRAHDARHLLASSRFPGTVRIDQGGADSFLTQQLKHEAFLAAVGAGNHDVQLTVQPHYDHSYFFVASMMETHVSFHADALRR